MELSHCDLMPSQQKTGSLIVPQAWGRDNCTDGIHGDTVAQVPELVGKRTMILCNLSQELSSQWQKPNS